MTKRREQCGPRKAPVELLCSAQPIRAFELQCEASIDVEARAADGQAKRPTFAIKAYTGGVIRVPGFYRPVVIDLAGLRAGRTVPILLDHDHTQIVGQATEVEIGQDKVMLAGVVTGDDEPATKVVMHAKNGFKWAASVGMQVEKLESVAENTTATVNGKKFAGPLLIARAGLLGEVSFVAVGADAAAAAKVAAKACDAKETFMDFEQWLEAKGFDAEALTDEQRTVLKASFDAEQSAAADGSKGKGEAEGPDDINASADDSADANAEDVPDVIAQMRADTAAESKRIAAVRKLCAGRHPDIEAKAIGEGWTPDKTELEVMRADRPTTNNLRRGGNELTAGALEASLCMSSGMSEQQAGEQFDDRTMEAALSRDLRGAGLHTLMYETIRAAGEHIRPGSISNDTIRAAFSADQRLVAAGGFSTISLSGILSNVANKAMLAAYNAVASVVAKFCNETDVNDFKEFTRYRLTGSGEFLEVGPDGELKHTTLTEEGYSNQVTTFGRLISLTRQMMINDDLGAFLQIPRIIGRMSALKKEKVVFTKLLSNPSSFFSTGNKNYISGVDTALSVAALTLAEQKFADQVDSADQPILVNPAVLLVPTSLKVTAQQLMTETRVNETTTANKPKPANNPHTGKWEPVSSPYLNAQALTGSSALAWYLFANPADVAAVEIAYLRGRRVPVIESGATNFNTLGMQWRGYFDFGVAMQDHRAAVMSKGEA